MPCSCSAGGQPGEAVEVERRGLVRVLAVAQDVGARPGGADEVGEAVDARRCRRSCWRTRTRRRRRRPRCAGRPGSPAGGAARRSSRRRASRRPRRSCRGSTTTATLGWFFAAARTMVGPPMSICSTHSSGARAGRDGVGEGVEVDDDEVERRDAELVELPHVVGQPAVGEDAGVHLRVQRLDPAVEALGEAGEGVDRGDVDAGLAQPGRGRAGADDLDPGGGERPAELLEPGLVVDAHEGALDGDRCRAHRTTVLPSTVQPPRASRATAST